MKKTNWKTFIFIFYWEKVCQEIMNIIDLSKNEFFIERKLYATKL